MIGEHAERSFDDMHEQKVTRFCSWLRGFGWSSLRASAYLRTLLGAERDQILLPREERFASRFLETYLLIPYQSKLSTATNSYGLPQRQRVGESE